MLAGAVLADLALESRIDTDLESLILLDATPTGDELLDPVLAQIAADSATRNAEYWIEKTVLRSDAVLEMVLDRLVEKQILNHHLGDFWSFSGSFSRTRTYSGGDGTAIADVKTRVFRTIAEDVAPDPRDAIIIGLVNACDAFRVSALPGGIRGVEGADRAPWHHGPVHPHDRRGGRREFHPPVVAGPPR